MFSPVCVRLRAARYDCGRQMSWRYLQWLLSWAEVGGLCCLLSNAAAGFVIGDWVTAWNCRTGPERIEKLRQRAGQLAGRYSANSAVPRNCWPSWNQEVNYWNLFWDSWIPSMTWGFHGGDYEDGCLLGDDGSSADLWNVGKLIPVYTALQPKRQPSSQLNPVYNLTPYASFRIHFNSILPSVSLAREVIRLKLCTHFYLLCACYTPSP
jgi:hypothetical protein